MAARMLFSRRFLSANACLRSHAVTVSARSHPSSTTRWSGWSWSPRTSTVTTISPRSAQIVPCRLSSTETVESSHKHWKMERIATIGLFGSVCLAFVYPAPIVDYSLALLVPLHAHWGMEQIVLDYIHWPRTHKFMHSLLYVFTFATMGGLLYFNYTDVGICKAVAKLYTQIG